MNDKQILAEVYRKLSEQPFKDRTVDHLFDRWHDIKDFIEQEWQKADEANGSYDMRVN